MALWESHSRSAGDGAEILPSRFAQDSQWNLVEYHISKARRLVKRTNASLFGSHGFVRFLECHVLMLQKMPEGVFIHTPTETRSQTLKVPASFLSFTWHLSSSLISLTPASLPYSSPCCLCLSFPNSNLFPQPRKSFHLPHVPSQVFLHGPGPDSLTFFCTATTQYC